MTTILAMPYATVLVFVQIAAIVGLVAVVASAVSLSEAIRDRWAVYVSGVGNGRRLLAIFAVRSEAARTVALGLLVGSLLTLLYGQAVGEPRPPGYQIDTTVAVTFIGLAVAYAVLAADAIFSIYARRRLDVELRSHASPVGDATVSTDDEEADHV